MIRTPIKYAINYLKYAPKKKAYSTDQYIGMGGKASKRIVQAGTRISRSSPIAVGEQHPLFNFPAKGLIEWSPEAYAIDIKNSRVVGKNGDLITQDDYLLEDISHQIGDKSVQHAALKRKSFNAPVKLQGNSLLLNANGASTNYFHWLFDLLPKLNLVELSGVELNAFDHILISGRQLSFQKESLNILGIPLDKIIWLNEKSHYKVDQLTASSLAGLSGNIPLWVVEFLRDRFMKEANVEQVPFRKIIIDRSDASNQRNNDTTTLKYYFKKRGFESVTLSELSFSEQIDLFREAQHVVGAHGAGFSNLVFSPQRVKVLEVFRSDYINQCYWTLSSQRGLHYYYWIGDLRLAQKEVENQMKGFLND